MDEGGWGEEWAGPSITAEASPSETFAGHDRATAWCLLAHAAEAELARGQRIWLEACGAGRQAAFCADPHTRQYLAALGAVHFVACVLRAAQRQRGGCVVGGVDDSTTIAEALPRCEDCWHNGMPGAPALKSAHAAAAAAETAALAAAVSEACGGLDAKLGDMEEGTPLCALTLLPLTLCPAVHAVAFEGGLCWAPVANLWANRVRQ
ncbi:hypothetical protein WJX75_003305 [Coccomyxa subellipsoidea]|uniref:Synergin gamma C-terminal domain-containing protein n=1 Tax=Coccomyxa subellipsoidea TaxID=248742 RepID=A0ABR2YV93_9CHLO